MKAGCCGLGIVGMIIKFVSKAIDVLVAVIVYCGLFYPIFYMVAVLFLMMLADFTFKPSIELTLFYVCRLENILIRRRRKKKNI